MIILTFLMILGRPIVRAAPFHRVLVSVAVIVVVVIAGIELVRIIKSSRDIRDPIRLDAAARAGRRS